MQVVAALHFELRLQFAQPAQQRARLLRLLTRQARLDVVDFAADHFQIRRGLFHIGLDRRGLLARPDLLPQMPDADIPDPLHAAGIHVGLAGHQLENRRFPGPVGADNSRAFPGQQA